MSKFFIYIYIIKEEEIYISLFHTDIFKCIYTYNIKIIYKCIYEILLKKLERYQGSKKKRKGSKVSPVTETTG